MLPIMPSTPLPSNWYPQMVPMGAARLVTKEIIAKMKNIVMMATIFLLLFFSCIITFLFIKFLSSGKHYCRTENW